MKKKYVGKKALVPKGQVCDVKYSYIKGMNEYVATASIPFSDPEIKAFRTVSLYYSSEAERDAEWEDILEENGQEEA